MVPLRKAKMFITDPRAAIDRCRGIVRGAIPATTAWFGKSCRGVTLRG